MSSITSPDRLHTFLPKSTSDSRVPLGHSGAENKPIVQPDAQLFSISEPGENAPI